MLNLYDLKRVPRTWRIAYIPKKNGEKRKLTIPNDQLKELQHDILQYLYELVRQGKVQVSSLAHGFVPYHSCVTSILKHDKESQVFLCCDMLHAFDLLDPEFAKVKLLDGGVSKAYADEIIGACAYQNSLPQGGPASPYLLNIAMFDADCEIAAYAKKHGFQYTRYADDLVFSIKDVDGKAMQQLRATEQAILAELEKLPPLSEKPTEKQLKKRQEKREAIYEKHRSKNPFLWFLYGVDTILQNTVNMRLNHKKDHVIFRGSKCKPHILGISIRQDNHGYNAERKLREETRCGLCNLWHKVFDKQRGKHTDEDLKEWLRLKGRVEYCDMVRRVSDAGYDTCDPRVQEKYYNPLERLFNAEQLSRQVKAGAKS